jgi:hypothetical protein
MSGHPPYPSWETASGDVRSAWLEHVRTCDPCHRRWAREDPSRLFSLLGEAGPEGEILREVTASVMAAVRSGTRRRPPGTVLARSAAVLAAGFLLAALVLPFVGDAEEAIPGDGLLGRAEVEVVSSPGTARVVDLNVGDTQVVMIFDERLEL